MLKHAEQNHRSMEVSQFHGDEHKLINIAGPSQSLGGVGEENQEISPARAPNPYVQNVSPAPTPPALTPYVQNQNPWFHAPSPHDH